MKKLYFSIFCLIYALNIQSQTVEWVRQTGGTDVDQGSSVKHDNQGNVFVAGMFRGSVSFDPNSNNYDFTATDNGDAYLQKYDSEGNFLWAKIFVSPEYSEFPKMVIDNQGDIYLTAQFQGSIDLDPGTGTDIHTTPPTGFSNSYIVKIDNNGNHVWGRSFEHVSSNQFIHIRTLEINNDELFISGNFQSTIDLDFGNQQYLITGSGNDTFFLKINTDGNFIWANALGGVWKTIIPVKVVYDNDNNIIIGGHFSGIDIDFDWGPNEELHSTPNNGNPDIFILKINSEGEFLWAISTEGCDIGPNLGICSDDLRSMAIDSNNDIYFTGAYEYYMNLEPETSNFILDSGVEPCTESPCFPYKKAFIAKISAQGQMIWAKDFMGDNLTFGLEAQSEIWNLVRLNNNGDLFFILSVYRTIDIDIDGNLISHTGTDDRSFMTFLNVNSENGSVRNAFFISGSLNVTPYDLEATNSRLYVTGRFWDETYFDPSNPLTPLGIDGFTLVIKDDLMGVQDIYATASIVVYPNPTEGIVTLKLRDSNIQKVIIRDVYGRNVKQITFPDTFKNDPQIDISELATGCYIFDVFEKGNKRSSYKLIKN